jgi:hypothetical protein
MELISLSYTIVPAILTAIPIEANKSIKGMIPDNYYHQHTNTND